jgi:HAD superfamily hydrolase (TIGR01509 family)
MKGVIFDFDGVLVDSMPDHYKAWKMAFKEVTDIEVNERMIYLLEGMRGNDLVKKIFEQKNYDNYSIAERVNERKNKIFKHILTPRAFDGVKELIEHLKCTKAVVSGSAKKDVEVLIDRTFGKNNFDVIITADDIDRGKPDPIAFITALNRMKINKAEAIVVENAPLGVEAANKAGIQCIIVLNNTPLHMKDFKSIISYDRIFKETKSATKLLENWCIR